MTDSPTRRSVIASLPPEPDSSGRIVGPSYGQILGAEVARMIQSLASQGDCDWSTLLLYVHKSDSLGRSGLPHLISVSAEAIEPASEGGES